MRRPYSACEVPGLQCTQHAQARPTNAGSIEFGATWPRRVAGLLASARLANYNIKECTVSVRPQTVQLPVPYTVTCWPVSRAVMATAIMARPASVVESMANAFKLLLLHPMFVSLVER